MDTSKEYIKMCEKAEEVQNLSDYTEDGNYFYVYIKYDYPKNFPRDEETRLFINCHDEFEQYVTKSLAEDYLGLIQLKWGYAKKGKIIWLPRQDQLQEIVKREHEDAEMLLKAFYQFCNVTIWTGRIDSWSMEQLWLLLFMKRKYNKSWYGDEWLSIR